MPCRIILSALSWATPDNRSLFKNLNLTFGSERTGLIGANGTGKSTLVKLINGSLCPRSGTISVSGTLGTLEQDLSAREGEIVSDALNISAALADIAQVLAGLATPELAAELDWTLETRLHTALSAVGLPGLDVTQTLSALSGGQRTRVALARLLLNAPEMLLLDEPTNNLDGAGRRTVAEIIGTWRGGAIVISHDRELLRRVDRIVELSSLGCRIYGGNWDHYAEQKTIERQAAAADLEHARNCLAATGRKIQAEKERKQKRDSAGRASRRKGGAPKVLLNARADRAGRTSSRLNTSASGRQNALESALDEAQTRIEHLSAPSARLRATGVPRGRTMMTTHDLTAGYDVERPLFHDLSLQIVGPERISVTGHNGSGKSTLLRLLAGDLRPITGRVKRLGTVAYFDQQLSLLWRDQSLLENFVRLNPNATGQVCRAALARFLFRAEAALGMAGDLSGGEQLRAALACTLGAQRPPEILILDEPTNHLDLMSIESVQSSLARFDGVLIVASHDPAFLEALGMRRHWRLPFDQNQNC